MRRGWGVKFADAFRGVWLAVRSERSFRVHLPMAAAVGVLAVLLRCDYFDWCLLLLCVGAVVAAEIFNSALEAFFHAQDDSVKNRVSGVLDRAAGAVLVASGTAAVVGLVILGRRAWLLLANGAT